MRGRKKKPFKAYRTQENEWIITNSDEKIVARVDAQDWHKQEYIEMGYMYQSDFIVDMVYHEKWGNYNLIEEVGSLMVLLGLKKAVWDDRLRVSNFEQYRKEHFIKEEVKAKENYNSVKQKMYKKHYDEAGKRNAKNFEAEINRYDSIVSMLDDLSDYPALKRILKTYKVHLQLLVEFGKNELLKRENLAYKNKEKYTFSVSSRYFSEYLSKNDIEIDHTNVSRIFNLGALLGLFKKEFDEVNNFDFKKIRKTDIYNITFFSLNDFNLAEAEKIAETLVKSKYKFNRFGFKYVLAVFGADIANHIYAKSSLKKAEEIETEEVEIEEIDQDTFFQRTANKLSSICPEMDLKVDFWYEDGGEDVPF